MNKTAAFVAVLVATLVFSSFAVFAFRPEPSVYVGPAISTSTLPFTSDEFKCPDYPGACTSDHCDEDLGSSKTHACHYPCVNGQYGAGEECGTNMCSGGQCNQAIS
ncbi:MAG: hypothetical protein KJ858_00325 [Nanoarchaeota archaeon]|nr:hypothetical protein [Nanoarchaeota archaeon]